MHSEEQHPTLKHRTLSKRGTPPFFHSGTNLVLGNALVHPFEKNPVLVVTAKLIWLFFLNILSFNLIQTLNKSLLGSENLEEVMCTTLLLFKATTVKLHCFFCLMCAVQSFHILSFAAVCPQK